MPTTRCSIAAIAVLMTACSSVPIERAPDGEDYIATLSSYKTDSSAAASARKQAESYCRRRAELYVAVATQPRKDQLRFRCEAPPAPPPPPPAPPPEQKATELEIGRAFVAWRDCLEKTEPTIDDMLSDANTIAASLSDRCLAEWAQYQIVSTQGWPQTVKDRSLQRAPSERREVARDIVLMVRAKVRNPAAKPPPPPVPRQPPTL